MNVYQISEIQDMLPILYKFVGESYVIVDEKKQLIVGAIKVIEPPKSIVVDKVYKLKTK